MPLQLTDKDGTSISGAKVLRDAAWHTLAEGQGDGGSRVTIKSFRPPALVAEDPSRAEHVVKERDRLVSTARLQKELSDSGACGWVHVRRISEDSANAYAVMEKCSGSVDGLIEHRVTASPALLYAVASGVLTGLEELWQRQHRSHENLKPSNILESCVNSKRRYCLSDPAQQGKKDTSANDLFALGQILFKLVEHKEYNAVNGRIHGSANWDILGGKKARWLDFCEYLLNPAGCQDALPQVRRRLDRLRPRSTFTRVLVLAVPAAAAAIALTIFIEPRFIQRGQPVPAPIVQDQPINPVVQQPRAEPSARPASPVASGSTAQIPFQPPPNVPPAINPRAAQIPLETPVVTLKIPIPSPPAVAPPVPSANPLAAAKDALRKKDYKSALTQFEESAKTGNAEAMTQLGWLYENGLGIELNFDLAMQWYHKAADLNDPVAMTNMGALYSSGFGHTESYAKDFGEAVKWFRKAADLGYYAAMCQLGTLYNNGDGVKQDLEEAMRWYRSAVDAEERIANSGNTNAMLNLAEVYYGEGGIAHNVAAAHGDLDFTEEHQCRAKAEEWHRKAADLGNVPAMIEVARDYEHGDFPKRKPDYEEAVRWYRKAADLGDTNAMTELARVYKEGTCVRQDYDESMRWLQKAGDLGDIGATYTIGQYYQYGIGMDQDYLEALKWYRKVADLEKSVGAHDQLTFCQPAEDRIGMFFEIGLGVDVDHIEAINWYRKSGNRDALKRLGINK